MNKSTILAFLVGLSSSSYASTFVDNGGTIYEAELRVALRQTKAALRELDYVKEKDLAQCAAHQRGKLCQYLSSFSKKETRLIQKVLLKHSEVMRRKIKGVKITLTDDSIKHVRSHGPWRKVQAGADPKASSIIINQEDFVNLSPAERVMLLVHELGHLIKIKGRYVKDDDNFDGLRGRELLDGMGASVAVVGLDSGDVPFKSEATESKAYRDHWLSYSVGSLKLNKEDTKKSLVPDQLVQYGLSYRLQFLSFGLSLSYDRAQQADYASGYSTYTGIDRLKLGATYKFHPFYTRADFWGHTHILVEAGASYNKYKHVLKDNYVSREMTGNAIAPYGEISVYFPVVRGFWITGTMGMVEESFQDESTRIDLGQPSTYTSLGVSYGF